MNIYATDTINLHKRILSRGLRLIANILPNFFALCIVLFIRLIKPLVTIRIGWIDIGRIGGSYDAFWNLDRVDKPRKTLDIYYFLFSTDHINTFWRKIWEDSVKIFPFPNLANKINRINRTIPGWESHNALFNNWPPPKKVIESILASETSIHYTFSEEEEKLGADLINKMGISNETPFVCYHVRDNAFLNEVSSNRDWSYHDFRDSNIDNYLPSMENLIANDKRVVRMGAIAKKRINTDNVGCIDYAFCDIKSDFLDVYLSSKCEFFVATISGIIILPEFFRKPIVYTNSLKISNMHSWVSNSLTIFKLFYSNDEQRLLRFDEILAKGFGHLSSSELPKSYNIEIIENSAEEISDVVLEMESRLNGSWIENPADLERQDSFFSIFGKDYLKSDSSKIGARFLKKYEDLLP